MMKRMAYKFLLKTNATQCERLSRFAGCNRLVWNLALALQKERLDQGQGVLRYEQTPSKLRDWKKELPFLSEVHSQPLQQTLMEQARAFVDAFKGTKGFPRFKKKGHRDSFKFPQGVKLEEDRIRLPKLGWFKFHKSREIEGTVKNVTVSRNLDRWEISIQVVCEVPEPVHPSSSEVGIDMGIVRFATMSNGAVIEPINSFKRIQEKLSRAQRKLSRRTKRSANWKKQKRIIQKIHSKIALVRKDLLHKITTMISKNHAVVVLEDLKVRNMSKSAKGTVDNPGTNVAAKGGLNRAILDQGWYEFRRQLTYKQSWRGGVVVAISPINTSRKCFECGHIAGESRESQANFRCVSCDHIENADLNAARNILTAGRAVVACGNIRQIAV